MEDGGGGVIGAGQPTLNRELEKPRNFDNELIIGEMPGPCMISLSVLPS